MKRIGKEDSMLIDIQYVKPNRRLNQNDFLYIIWKDLKDGKKYLTIIEEPKMDIYFEKLEYRDHTNNKEYGIYEG